MDKSFILPYIISNISAILFLIASLRWHNVARVLFAALFIWACWANWNMAHNNPSDYLGYGKYAIDWYKSIINGIFAQHIQLFVSFVAICQLLIGICLLLKGYLFRLGCVGGIIFLTAIAPLGFGAAFPCSIILGAGLYKLYKIPATRSIFSGSWAY